MPLVLATDSLRARRIRPPLGPEWGLVPRPIAPESPESGDTWESSGFAWPSVTLEPWFIFRTAVQNARKPARWKSCARRLACFASTASRRQACGTSGLPPICRPATCITTSAARTNCSSSARTAPRIGCCSRSPRPGANADRCRRAFAIWPRPMFSVCWTKSRARRRISRSTRCRPAFARASSPSAMLTNAACARSSPRGSGPARWPLETPSSPRAPSWARSTGRRTGSVPRDRNRPNRSPNWSPTMPSVD